MEVNINNQKNTLIGNSRIQEDINNNKEKQSVNFNLNHVLFKEGQNIKAIDRNKIDNFEQNGKTQTSKFIQETSNNNQYNKSIIDYNINNNKSDILYQTEQDYSRKKMKDNNNNYNIQIDNFNFGNSSIEINSQNKKFVQKNSKNDENKNPLDIPYNKTINSENNKETNNNEIEYILGNQLNTEMKKEEIKNYIFINIIYLVDLTYSMKKHRKILNNIEKINLSLKEKYPNVIFGYVFYRDFINHKSRILKLNLPHIKVFKSSPSNYNIPDDNFVRNSEFSLKFENGGDYAEDWANSYYEISEFDINSNYENIVIHFCDSGAHGHKFSDYDDNNEQEKLLEEALKRCSLKKIKIIGLIFNEFNRKSFLECQNIYNKEQGGYYNLVDLTYLDLDYVDWILIIKENIEKALKNIINENFDDYTRIPNFENGFDFGDGEELKNIQMLNLEYIKFRYFEDKKIKFLPEFDNNNTEYILNRNKKFIEIYQRKKTKKEIINNTKFRDAIEQGYLGDCYLISSMISILFGNLPLIRFIFPLYQDYDENTKKIFMYIFKNGYRKLISFKNTYPIQVNKEKNSYTLPFSKPLNDSFALICLEKGYAAFKSDKKTIKSGYKTLNRGGQSCNVLYDLLGTKCDDIYLSYGDKMKLKIKIKNI